MARSGRDVRKAGAAQPGAGLDVLAVEPASPGHPLFARDTVVVTPHAAC
jgi:phosphoglycerate dehydrogenase-like enzyme